jgi:hypothetical protein
MGLAIDFRLVALGCVPDRFGRRGEEKNTFASLKCNPGRPAYYQ